MSRQSDDAFAFIVIVALAIWWWSARGDTISTYWVLTSTGAQEAEERFSADRSSNTVVKLMKGPESDNGFLITFSNCSVLDYKNWWCPSGYGAANGKVTGSPFESDPRVRSVRVWRYWLAPSPAPKPKEP
jgi:hypothetical protein